MSKNILCPGFYNYLINDKVYLPNLYDSNQASFNQLYCFLSGIVEWTDENSPPDITYSDLYEKTLYKNMFVIKKINSSDICAVIERIDWVAGTVYQYYNDSQDMFARTNGKLNNHFYVRNKYDQVFKCLWNNLGATSTVEPKINYGYDVNNTITNADGYKWKYLFTINSSDKYKFFDTNWIPVSKQAHKFDLSLNTKSSGEIFEINVIDGGNGYVNDSSGGEGETTTVTITGDGFDATAKAKIVSGSVSRIRVVTKGYGYSSANVSVVSTSAFSGNTATSSVTISPIGGFGYDLLKELGCDTVAITCTFDETTESIMPTDIDFRQVGLMINPNLTSGGYADGVIYNTTTTISCTAGQGNFILDEVVYQGTSLGSATFTGRVSHFSTLTSTLYIINTNGTFKPQNLITGASSGAIRQALVLSESEIVPFSGKIVYLENRKKIQRSATGIEQFKLFLTH